MSERGQACPESGVPTGRIALVSSGLSHIRRGYESFIADLHESLRGRVSEPASVTLLKGSGPVESSDVIRVPTLRRNSPLSVNLWPLENTRYRYEQASMALAGWLQGHWPRYDIIHFCDPVLGNALLKLRRVFGYSYKLLFANCGPAEPHDYRQFDHIQEFTPEYLERAERLIPPEQLSLIPMGVHPEHFRTPVDKAVLRDRWGIPSDAFVVLCVASLDEPYKRLGFLIETVSALEDAGIFLLLAGQNQNTPCARETLSLAQAKLAGRFRHLTVPYEEIPALYKAADLFILPSLEEGFGKVYLEAMASGTPLLCHDNPHTRWIVPSPESRVDMEAPQAVMAAIQGMRGESGSEQSDRARVLVAQNRQWVMERFDWNALRSDYLAMYAQLLANTQSSRLASSHE